MLIIGKPFVWLKSLANSGVDSEREYLKFISELEGETVYCGTSN